MNLDVGTDRFRQRVFAVGVVAVSLLTCSRAFAWGFDEHTELGSKGYKAACDQLAHDLNVDVQPKPAPPGAPDGVSDPCMRPKDDTTRPLVPRLPRVLAGALRTIRCDRRRSRRHAPTSSGRRAGQIVATNVVDYTFLALVNVQHFHPAAPRNWRTFHDKALELATKDYPGGPIARDFAQVFYTSAFADHFLQDAFSAGHAGSTGRPRARWRRKDFMTSGTRRVAW